MPGVAHHDWIEESELGPFLKDSLEDARRVARFEPADFSAGKGDFNLVALLCAPEQSGSSQSVAGIHVVFDPESDRVVESLVDELRIEQVGE